ncbi:MAG TPA: hypothetical protein VGK67_13110 [Myxococcales bacterium]|jgi:hypothetical protein
MLTLATALLALTLSEAPPKVYIDPRIKEAAAEEKRIEGKYVDKKHHRKNEKGLCGEGCKQVVNMCMSNCRGAKACKDNCTNTVEKSCVKGCATKNK